MTENVKRNFKTRKNIKQKIKTLQKQLFYDIIIILNYSIIYFEVDNDTPGTCEKSD